jgi:hypothetical protein
VTRRWSSFDTEITNKEAAALPSEDRKKLFRSMKAYVSDEEGKCVVRNYGGGLYMIKDRSQGQGRCLFFTVHLENAAELDQIEMLVALMFYKKESQEIPGQIFETAQARLRRATT